MTDPHLSFFKKLRSDCTIDELRSLYRYARTFAPSGAVCDVGCGDGGSTAVICRALADAGLDPRHQVYAYDLFEDHSSPHASTEMFKQTTVGFSEFIRVVKGDLRRPTEVPEPIDLLFIDAAKSLALHEAINQAFLPNLRMPCLLLNQDFGRPHLYWIHLMFADLLDSARRLDIIDDMIIVELSAHPSSASVPGLEPSKIDFETAHATLFRLRDRLQGRNARDGVPYEHILTLSLCSLSVSGRRQTIAAEYLKEFESACSEPPRHLRRPIEHLKRAMAKL